MRAGRRTTDDGGWSAPAGPLARLGRWAAVIVPVLLVLALFSLVLGVLTARVPLVIVSVVLSAAAVVFIGLGALRLRPQALRPSRTASVVDAAAVPEATLGDLVAGEDTEVDADAGADDAGPAGESLDVVTPEAVWVVPGLARYHRGSCVQLTGKPAEPRSLVQVLDAGLTACSLCAPPTAAPQGG